MTTEGPTAAGSAASLAGEESPRRRRARLVVAVLVVVVAVLGTVGSAYADVIGAYLTHRIGGPPHTSPVWTLPSVAQPEVRIAFVGDVGGGGGREQHIAATIANQSRLDRYDLMMLLGDNVYPSGDPERLSATVYEPFGPIVDGGTKLLAILGNHDVENGNGDAQLRALGMPGRWYAVGRGDVLRVALDSTDPTNPDQLAWLEAMLAATDATWKLVGLHHPPYSSGYPRLQSRRPGRIRATVRTLRRPGRVLRPRPRLPAQHPINGVTYIVTGGGSRTRRTGIDDFTAVAYSTHHYVDLNVFDDHILLRAIDQDGEQFDQAVIPVDGEGAADTNRVATDLTSK